MSTPPPPPPPPPPLVTAEEAEIVHAGDLVVRDTVHAHELVNNMVEVPKDTRLLVQPCHTGTMFVLTGRTTVVLPLVADPSVPVALEFVANVANFDDSAFAEGVAAVSFECAGGQKFAVSSIVRRTTFDGFVFGSCGDDDAQINGPSTEFQLPGQETGNDGVARDVGRDIEFGRSTKWLQIRAQTTRSPADGSVQWRVTGQSVC